jgi:hypothetical protein
MLRETVELLDAAQQGHNAKAMGAIITQELKRRFGCTRVSLGLVHGHFIRAIAMSGVDEIDRTAAAIEPLEALMEECAAQDSEVIFPPPSNLEPMMRRVTRDHEHFSRAMGPAAILSLPLRVEGGIVGVVVLEREPTDPLPLAATARPTAACSPSCAIGLATSPAPSQARATPVSSSCSSCASSRWWVERLFPFLRACRHQAA